MLPIRTWAIAAEPIFPWHGIIMSDYNLQPNPDEQMTAVELFLVCSQTTAFIN